MSEIFTYLKFGTVIKAILLLFCYTLLNSSFAQTEKRLALVIGNANYEKGALKNPVNDALLMASTLESLGFDVILDTNIVDKINFIRTIRKFGDKRRNYDVAMVYYAGHGIQIGAENYLLPTKANFESEYDVTDFGVNVQDIMRYLTGITDQVNILILDACRDNPFEGNWNKTRSLKGQGLAKIPPPTGSIIAFSTDAGNTAADGNNENSIYCMSLSENLLLENVSLDQIFRNVRSEVLNQTNGDQRPIEASQLTGKAFYFKKSTYTRLELKIQSLIDEENYLKALELSSKLITLDSNNYMAYTLQGDIYFYLDLDQNANKLYKKAIKIAPKNANSHYNLAYSYYIQDSLSLALQEIKKANEIDSKDEFHHSLKSKILTEIGNYSDALVSINLALQLNPSIDEFYNTKFLIYNFIDEPIKAMQAIDSAVLLNPNEVNHRFRGLHNYNLRNFEQAIIDFNFCITLNPSNYRNYILRSDCYLELKLNVKANEDLNTALNFLGNNASENYIKGDIFIKLKLPFRAIESYTRSLQSDSISDTYLARGWAYSNVYDYKNALANFNKSVEMSPEDPKVYTNRGDFQQRLTLNYEAAINDYDKSINLLVGQDSWYEKYRRAIALAYLNKTDQAINELNLIINNSNKNIDLSLLTQVHITLGAVYQWGKNDYNKALKNYNKAISLDSTDIDSYIRKAELYNSKNETNLAFNEYSKLMNLNPSSKEPYSWRAKMNYSLSNFEQAILDYKTIIKDDPREPEPYYYLAKIYITKEKYFAALEMLTNTITWFQNSLNGYWITSDNNYTSCNLSSLSTFKKNCTIDLIDLFNERAQLYVKFNAKDEACEDYADACSLGDCGNYNSYCK